VTRILDGRFALSALASAVALFAVSFIAFLVVGPAEPKTHLVSVDEFHGERDGGAQRDLTRYLAAHGATDCQPYVPRVTKDRGQFIAQARASGAVRCDAVGTGPSVVIGLRFKDAGELKAWEADNHDYVAGSDNIGSCESNYGETPWANAKGRVTGRLFCEQAGDGSAVAWSVPSERSAYYATSDEASIETVLAWWKRNVLDRGDRAGALSTARTVFDEAIRGGIKRCKADATPLADLSLECGPSVPAAHPKDHLSILQILHFSSADALDAYFKVYTKAFRAPTGRTDQFCDRASLASGTYYHQKRPAGRIFCFPSGHSEWLVWTLDDHNMAGLISRNDQNARALYRIWEDLP
jgi:hypothetical protein